MLYLNPPFFTEIDAVTEPAPIESTQERRPWHGRLWDRLRRPAQEAVLPRLGPRPRYMLPVYLALLLTAWIVLQPASRTPWSTLPGNLEHPDASYALNNHWVIQSRGFLASLNSRLLAFPVGEDRFVTSGFPLDVLAAWPLVKLLGWPAGLTVFLVLALWAAGAAMAWLAGRWWRSAWAAAVAGVAYQTSGVLLVEATRGAYHTVLGAVFVPLALGLLARALVTRSQRDGLLAGACAGLAALAYWYLGWFVGLGAAALVLLGFVERRAPWRVYLAAATALVVVAGLPLVYTAVCAAEAPGYDIDKWDMILTGAKEQSLAGWVASENGLLSEKAPVGLWAWRPVLVGLVLLGIWRRRRRRWMAPALWIALGLLLAIGPWVVLPGGLLLPGPQLGSMDTPMLRRMWWPYRALLLAAPAVALLAAGGAARLHGWLPRMQGLADRVFARLREMEVEHAIHRRWVPRALPHLGYLLAALLLAEAFLVQPRLPLASMPFVRSAAARTLSRGGKGPALVLPFGRTPMRKDTFMYVDQIHHRRPLLNSPTFPHASLVTLRMRRSPTWAALDYLGLCEVNPKAKGHKKDFARAMAGLRQVGLKAVHVQMTVVQAAETRLPYLRCIERMLGSRYDKAGPFRVYPVSAKKLAAR